MSDGVKKPFFQDREQKPEYLDFYLRQCHLTGEVKSFTLLNPNTPGVAIMEIASAIEVDMLDLVVNNQVKILEEPGIIEQLRANPGLSVIHKQKLDEYERLLLKELVDSVEVLQNKSTKEIEAEAIAEAKAFVETFGKEKETKVVAKKAPEKVTVAHDEEKDQTDILKQRMAEDAAKQKRSVLELIQEMSVPQKIQAAIKGDREYRNALIRDSNKLVSCAVVKSPRVTESEIEFYSNLRNVQTDVLRLIAMNREWTKNYKVVLNLVRNPRTPLAFTLKLFPRLNKTDVRMLMRDKNIPEALRTVARRHMTANR